MPFVPISDEELKSLNSLESKRFVPISNEELKALNSSLQLASQQPAKSVTGTTTKVSATSTGKLPAAEPYQVPLPDAMVSVSGGRTERNGGSADSLAPAPFESVVNNPDFATLSKYKSEKSDAGKRFDFQNKAYHYLNDSSYWDGNQTLADIDAAIFTRNDALSEMTPLEISIYNYYVNSGDRKTAQAYLQSLRTKLQERKADTIAKEISKKDGADKVLSAAGLALTGGMSAANSGLEQYLEMLTGSDKIVDKNWMEQAQANVRPELSGGLGVMSDVLYSAGNMANSAVLGAANPVAGATLMGAQTAGNAYGDTIKEGYSKNEALLYAGINGALESGLQYVLGGIGALGKGGASKLLAKVPALQTLGKTIEASIKNPTVQAGLKSAGKYIASMGDEAFEEYLQSVVDPVVRNAVLDENNELNPLSEDALYSALVGAISGGLMNLPGAVTDFTGSKRADTSANGQWTNGANDDIMKTVKGGSLDGKENAQQENAPGGHAGVSGQIFTVTDSELEKTVPGMERRADYRGVGLAVTEALQKRGITPVALAYTNDSDGFHQAIGRAKQNNMHGAFVTQHEVSEYANDALFLSEDGDTGVAVTPDGDIVSVFKNPNGKAKKAVHSILLTALENGGVKLDNFDGALSDMYWNHGFIPVARTSFDPEFAPTDWNYERDGQPDIIFWVHNGEDAQTVAKRIGEYGDLPDLTKLPVMSYDEAAAYRDNILKQRADSGNTGSAFFDADSKDSTDNIDAIVRDVFGYGQQTDAQANPGNGDVQSDKWSKPESQWTAENQNVDANEGAAIKSVTEIVQKIRNAFGIPISTGKFNQRAYGIYKTRAEAIRTKVSDALPTIAHELGHHFDKRYGLYILPSTNEAIQVLISTRPEFAQSYEVEQLPGEAVAEFMRDYLTDRTLAKSKYPEFYKTFVKVIPEDQIKKLNSIGDDINRYMFADLHERAKANIVTREESQKIYRSQKSLGDLLTRAKELFSDTAAKVELFGKDAHDRYWISKDVDGMIERMIAGEYMTDIDGKPVEWPDETGHVKPVESLARIMSEITESQKKEFDAYLTYRHGLEFLANGKRVFADDRLNSSEYMRKKIESMEAEFPAFKETAEKIYRWHDIFMRKWVVEPGLITKGSYELLRKKYPSYVPFYRAVENGKGGARGSVANQNSPIKRAKGSGKAILSPVENICVSVDKCVKAADRNAVMQVMAKALRENDGLGYLMEEVPASRIPKTVSSESIKQKISKALKDAGVESDITEALNEAIGADVTQWVVNPHQGADIVWMIEDGKKKYFQIHDKGLMAALTNLTPYQANGFFSVLGTASRAFKALNTGANPIWAAQSNAIRDFFTTWHYGSENNPIKFMGQYIKAIVDTVNGLRGKEGMYSEYRAGGGGNSASISNPKQIKSVAQDLYKQDRGGFRKVLENRIRILEAIEAFSDVIETAPRLAEYTRQRKQGVDIRHSVLAADEVSVNFKRKGQMSPQLDAVYPYFNASVQGISKMIRFAKSNPKAFWTKHITTSLLLVALVIGWNKFFMDDEDEYEKLSNYMKNNYYCFSVGDGKFVRIAKAKELAVLESLIERTYEAGALGNDQAFGDFANYTALQFLPPGVPTPEDPLAPVSDMIGVGTVVDLAANKNFSGAPIVPSQYQKLEPYAQYNDKTSWFAKAFGQAMGLSPMQIDYVISDNLGIIGNLNKALGANDKDWSLGILNKATADNAYSTDVLNNFYDTLEELEMRANTNPQDGHAVGTYKQYQSMQSIISQLNKFGRESKDDERTFKATARDYASAFHSSQAGKIDERLIALYERTQSKSIFPYKTFSASFTKDGKTVNLTPAQFLDYVDEYERTLEESYQKILSMNISDEKKVEKLEKAKRDLTSSMNKKYGGGSSGSDKLKAPTYEETAIDRLLKGALS